MWRYSVGIRGLEEVEEGADKNLDVEKERPVLDVPEVILGSLRDGSVASQSIDLRPAGHAGSLPMTVHIARDRVAELVDVYRALWPRTYQAHFS